MSETYKGTLQVLASAAGFGTLAIFIKFAYAAGGNTVSILGFRFLAAALFFWSIIHWRKLSFDVTRRDVIRVCLLGGIGYGAMSALFASTVEVVPAALAGMLLYTYPAQVSILSFLLGDEQFTWRKGFALALCFCGLWLVLDASFANVGIKGLVLGISSAFVYSAYIVLGNRLIRHVDPLLTTTLVCSSTAVLFLLAGAVSGNLMIHLPAVGWGAIAGMALFATVVAILGFFAGMKAIGATNASIISTVEPVITVILSAILLAESITLTQAFGGALILAGVIVLQLGNFQQNPG